MPTKSPSITEQKIFAAASRDAQFISERHAAEKKRSNKVDRLRALRLAKEAADAETAKAAGPAPKRPRAKAKPAEG